MRRSLLPLLLGLALARPADAQEALTSVCNSDDVQQLGAREECLATVQAMVSAQPAFGILIAGGNPTIGSSGAAGFRLGLLPRVSAGVRLNVVAVRLPGIIAEELPGGGSALSRRFGAPLPSLNADASVAITRGFSVAPGLGGIGAISLLGSVSYLPLTLFDADGFKDVSNRAFGLGARVHLIDESFVAPGVSLSIIRRSLDEVKLGDTCEGTVTDVQAGSGSVTSGACGTDGDSGEIAFDLTSWSTRLVASKHLLGFGVSGGVGYDRHGSDLAFAFRGDEPVPGTSLAPVYEVTGQDLSSGRWTVFGNASYTVLVGSIGVEGGWQQGSAPIPGFGELDSGFDPEAGTWYGSIAARLSL